MLYSVLFIVLMEIYNILTIKNTNYFHFTLTSMLILSLNLISKDIYFNLFISQIILMARIDLKMGIVKNVQFVFLALLSFLVLSHAPQPYIVLKICVLVLFLAITSNKLLTAIGGADIKIISLIFITLNFENFLLFLIHLTLIMLITPNKLLPTLKRATYSGKLPFIPFVAAAIYIMTATMAFYRTY